MNDVVSDSAVFVNGEKTDELQIEEQEMTPYEKAINIINRSRRIVRIRTLDLSGIGLSQNDFERLLPLIKESIVERLYLRDNHIEHIPSRCFESMPNLDILDLSNNNIKNISPNAFSTSEVSIIDLSNNEIERIDRSAFNNYVSRIDLSNNKLSDNYVFNFGIEEQNVNDKSSVHIYLNPYHMFYEAFGKDCEFLKEDLIEQFRKKVGNEGDDFLYSVEDFLTKSMSTPYFRDIELRNTIIRPALRFFVERFNSCHTKEERDVLILDVCASLKACTTATSAKIFELYLGYIKKYGASMDRGLLERLAILNLIQKNSIFIPKEDDDEYEYVFAMCDAICCENHSFKMRGRKNCTKQVSMYNIPLSNEANSKLLGLCKYICKTDANGELIKDEDGYFVRDDAKFDDVCRKFLQDFEIQTEENKLVENCVTELYDFMLENEFTIIGISDVIDFCLNRVAIEKQLFEIIDSCNEEGRKLKCKSFIDELKAKLLLVKQKENTEKKYLSNKIDSIETKTLFKSLKNETTEKQKAFVYKNNFKWHSVYAKRKDGRFFRKDTRTPMMSH